MTTVDERELIERLRRGDEASFVALVDQHGAAMRRLARMFVSTDASALEIVQEVWTAVLEGLAGFEGRSSLKTWIFQIVVNRAKTRGVREKRVVPMADPEEADAPAVDPARFDARGMWSAPPPRWEERSPEDLLQRKETVEFIREALERLPERQRAVVTLRDVEGWSAEHVCNILDLNETNQRVLLHRGRSRLRALLEQRLGTNR